jgi:hypothetical protein
MIDSTNMVEKLPAFYIMNLIKDNRNRTREDKEFRLENQVNDYDTELDGFKTLDMYMAKALGQKSLIVAF